MRVHLYNQWRTFIVITLLYLCLLYEHLLGLADDSRVDKMYWGVLMRITYTLRGDKNM